MEGTDFVAILTAGAASSLFLKRVGKILKKQYYRADQGNILASNEHPACNIADGAQSMRREYVL